MTNSAPCPRPAGAHCSKPIRPRVLLSVLAVVLPCAQPMAVTFTNPAAITINDNGCSDGPWPATPYPSNLTVSGLSGTISKVTVRLNGITHAFQGDLEVLLVGPGGGSQNITILSDAGTGAFNNATITFAAAAASFAPQNVAWAPGTYRPTN